MSETTLPSCQGYSACTFLEKERLHVQARQKFHEYNVVKEGKQQVNVYIKTIREKVFCLYLLPSGVSDLRFRLLAVFYIRSSDKVPEFRYSESMPHISLSYFSHMSRRVQERYRLSLANYCFVTRTRAHTRNYCNDLGLTGFHRMWWKAQRTRSLTRCRRVKPCMVSTNSKIVLDTYIFREFVSRFFSLLLGQSKYCALKPSTSFFIPV